MINSWEFWIMLIIHGILFVMMRRKINRKKVLLEKDNSRLEIENEQQKGQINSLKNQLGRKYRG